MFVESLIISKPLFPCSGAVLIEVRAPSSKARQHWPFAGQFLCIYYHRKRSTEKQSWFCQQLWSPFTLPGHTFSIPEGMVLPAWRPALPPPGHSQGTCWLPPWLPKGSQQLSRAMPRVSAKASPAAFPALQVGEASPTSWKNGPKHHFWPEHHGEAGGVALVFGRLLVLDEGEVWAAHLGK